MQLIDFIIINQRLLQPWRSVFRLLRIKLKLIRLKLSVLSKFCFEKVEECLSGVGLISKHFQGIKLIQCIIVAHVT